MNKRLFTVVVSLLVSLTSALAIEDNTVEVVYNGSSATVTVANNISSLVSSTVDGTKVSIIQSAAVNDNTGEIIYYLSGSSDNGTFYMEGTYKATVVLNDLTLTNTAGPAINIQNGKRIKFSCAANTTNTLTDAANGDWKGCLMCKGHSEFRGRGTLIINGKTGHGVWSNEYVEVKNCTLSIRSAQKDGINCNQYFLMESGTVEIIAPGDDGIQVSYKDNPPLESEDTGKFTQQGGTISITGHGGVCIKADGAISLSGGTQNFNTSDVKEYDAATGISAVEAFQQDQPEAVYDLSGHRMTGTANLPKGIYIIKGKNNTKKIRL